jgi:hypothetical protein
MRHNRIDPATDIFEQTIPLTAADGFTFEAFRATPRGTPMADL